jgi:hypothetical protein
LFLPAPFFEDRWILAGRICEWQRNGPSALGPWKAPQIERIGHKLLHLATSFADGAAVLLKIRDALSERLRDLLKPYRAYPVDAFFVLLHLLK